QASRSLSACSSPLSCGSGCGGIRRSFARPSDPTDPILRDPSTLLPFPPTGSTARTIVEDVGTDETTQTPPARRPEARRPARRLTCKRLILLLPFAGLALAVHRR